MAAGQWRYGVDMVFVVEDDTGIKKLLLVALAGNGYEVEGFSSGEELFPALEKKKPELILLDVMLPGKNGIDILSDLKKEIRYKDIPVIMVTAKDSEYDKILGFDTGADDYISKPFSMLELLSRVKAVLRRSGKKSSDSISIGGIVLSKSSHSVSVDNTPVSLSYKEFELLSALMENSGMVLSREVLLDKVWGYSSDSETRTIDVHIRHLREKLGEKGELIETIKGVGYKMQG